MSTDVGSKVDSKKTGPKIKSVLSTTKHTSDFLVSDVRSKTRPPEEDNFWLDCEGWLWYYRRYVDVKKGGEAGLELSHWRKYH
ncbi:uncharacterized protein [Nothobranchius furzeri]|uniref:uncharacterized protein isoform X2 n=1 Tax=Nothobranchius furzeri TaxID=105023 RepID=UPI003904BEB6